ncbi:NAD(P)-dependent oxidoreductase [Frigoribacterium faeni]|uniref:Dihydrofolate reductase n=1 Tax=Frigoribacterium faeni TaxID=145483 RepID=A0A7W3PIB3_9MICO|nr:NAD(P)-dependent oxidoreductase [Frigoribacterium faeni]MBA8812726.1 phosphoglycerate dehydrogenase-like enzyme [Frigoribacterium faeni]BFF13839.1 D-isomer specific 2-hydroxyacid dehydrogenase family protein [Microbacterium flavescens]GEK82260.1 dihydrofolate reductase [Frigoribacterium faeni]
MSPASGGPGAAERGHRSTAPTTALDAERRPTPGPVSLAPRENARFVAAVEDAGGAVVPLGDETRGLVWLSYSDVDGLDRALREHPGIEWVQLPYAGVDAFADILARHADRPRPLWTSAKGAFSEPVAEHALMLVLALLRVVPSRVQASAWQTEQRGISLYGKRVVIVGAGGIALELVRLLAPFETRVTIVRRGNTPVDGVETTVTVDRLDEVLPEADVVVLAAAATPGTSKLLDARRLALLRPTAVLVNVARGDLVDTDALVDAVRAERIWGAGVDVTSPEPLPEGHPLWGDPRVIVTPHQADTPEMTAPLLAERIRRNVRALNGDGDFAGVVDPAQGY